MSDGLHVVPEEMYAAGANTLNEAANVDDEVKALNASIKELVGSNWHGDAANEFEAMSDAKIADLNSFNAILTDLGNAINKAADELVNAENENIQNAKQEFDEF